MLTPDHSRTNSVFDLIRIFLKNRAVRQLERKKIWMASALLAGGLLLTLTACLLLKSDVEQDAKNEFDITCTDLNNKISARLYTHAQLLRSGAAFLMNSDEITRDEWRNFYVNQRIEKNLPGIQGFGYSVIIPRYQLAPHEKKIQSEGFPHYSVRPKGKREIYTSVIYLEPFSGRNLHAFGYDMFSEPIHRKAMEISRDSNIATLTKKIMFDRETNEDIQAGTLMYVPVYKKGMPAGTVEECRRAIKGWAYSPYRMNDLMKGILGSTRSIVKKNIRLEIFDDFSFNRNALLYDNKQDIDRKVIPSLLFSLKYSVPFNGNLWYLRFTKYDSAKSGPDYSKVWYAATGGISFSILLFVIYLLLINTNIRAHKLAEELTRVLRGSEAKYSSMISNISDVVCIIDADGIFKYNSPNIEKWFGWQPQDLLGTDVWLIVHPDDMKRVQKRFFSLPEKDNPLKTVECRYKCKDGSYKPISLTAASLINDPIINGVLINYHDITRRKEIEEGLEKTRKELVAIKKIADEAGEFAENTIDTVRESLIVLDQELRVVKASRSFYDFFKVSPEETIGKLIYDLGNRQWNIPKLRELLETILLVETTFDNYEVEHDFSEVGKRTMLLNARQIQREPGVKEKVILLAIEDITEQKTAQSELMRLNEDLQKSKMQIEKNLIQEHSLVEDLTKTKEKLEVINSEKNKLFSIIAHDLKGPFQGFMELTELMAEDINSIPQDELSVMAREMHLTSKKLFLLLNNLLEWARMQQGAISFNPTEIVLSEIVSENIDLIIKRGEQKGIEIINETDQDRTVHADKEMLNSILRNFLSNAVKFTRQGGKVIVKLEKIENSMMEISVTDSGIGMSETLSQRLFKVDEKVGRKGTDGEPSTGLGLLLCKEFVEKHGGRIRVKSEKGKGTAFYFTIPAMQQISLPVME
ncbi:MAG: CHASE domain-containing protein [Ignavibacteria bacterium]